MLTNLRIKGADLKEFAFNFCFNEDEFEEKEVEKDGEKVIKRGKKKGVKRVELLPPESQWQDLAIVALFEGAEKLGFESYKKDGLNRTRKTDEEYDEDKHDGYFWKFSEDEIVITEFNVAECMHKLFENRIKNGYEADIDLIRKISKLRECFDKAELKAGKAKQKAKKKARNKNKK